MKKIREMTEKSANKILALGEKSKEINNVLEIIYQITEQTKLIAFNAAIESAGAGEGWQEILCGGC